MAAAHVNHHEDFSGLAPGLVNPHDLPRFNTDGDVWLMPLLLLGFGSLGRSLVTLTMPIGICTY